MNWITTADGSEHHFAGQQALSNRYNIGTIARALAKINRFTGHTDRPYSVAEHSLLVADILASQGHPPIVQLAGLMHDAHEAFVGDVSSPAKVEIGAAWQAFEAREEHYLRYYFQLISVFVEHGADIKRADLIALATERRDLLKHYVNSTPWAVLDSPGAEVQPWHSDAPTQRSYILRGHDVFPWHHYSALFLSTYQRLMREIGATA